ncbi:SDR family NAD(P)-dependent oxidoreductase [Longispora albida]|uniref:SDR family NAD(P)-dependent oxidoreductase n=1 Tax=Longispora albida TaxID=203523 RepID=UPI00036E3EA9|nr:SDR family NAD(P)-dependent oxidoreductase [Longispora albida]
MPDLTGKVAVVTGGTRGIGRASAEALAAAGATVIITGRDAEKASEVAKEIGAASGLALDVTDFDAVGSVIKGIAGEHGKIDILVANAGIMESGLLGMLKEDHVRRVLDTNVTGAVAAVQAAARVMTRKKTGAIVLLASIAGAQGSAGQSVYAASKAALEALTKSAAKELGGRGVRVNAVAPGVIATDLTAGLSDEVLAKQRAATPLGRLGEASDVAKAITFLVSDDAAFITGQVLGVDGGLVL